MKHKKTNTLEKTVNAVYELGFWGDVMKKIFPDKSEAKIHFTKQMRNLNKLTKAQ